MAWPAHSPKHVASKAEYVGHLLIVGTEVSFLHASTLNKSTDNDIDPALAITQFRLHSKVPLGRRTLFWQHRDSLHGNRSTSRLASSPVGGRTVVGASKPSVGPQLTSAPSQHSQFSVNRNVPVVI
jgi:hypothetical protein